MDNENNNNNDDTNTRNLPVAANIEFLTPVATIQDLKSRVDYVHEAMRSVMQEGMHYGTIPGCGDKPALLKPGAEFLCSAWGLAPQTEEEIIDLGGGHREYRIKCKLYRGERYIADGLASCSTMETKYRYRQIRHSTGIAVPKEYWDTKNEEVLRTAVGWDKRLADDTHIGPMKLSTGAWVIAYRSTVEHSNIADTYNTVLKMAHKRALVAATLIATGVSSLFGQDIEEEHLVERKDTEAWKVQDVDGAAAPSQRIKEGQKQYQKTEYSDFDYAYHLPVKKEGVDMSRVREAFKKEGARWNPDDKMWYTNYLSEPWKEYIRGGKKGPASAMTASELAQKAKEIQPESEKQVDIVFPDGDDLPESFPH